MSNNIFNLSFDANDVERIKELARTHFDRNPRQIKSFIRDIVFLLSLITQRQERLKNSESASDRQERSNIEEIIENPVLLAKIIVIRERFSTVFEEIRKKPEIIEETEKKSDYRPNFKDGSREYEQWEECGKFIRSHPKFTDMKVNPLNFIYLGSSTGASNGSGIDVGLFINYAQSGDTDNYYESIKMSPDYKKSEYLKNTCDAYDNNTNGDIKNNIKRSVITSIKLLDNIRERNVLLDRVLPWVEDDYIFSTLNSAQIARWIDAIADSSSENVQLDRIKSESPFNTSDQELKHRCWEALTIQESGQIFEQSILFLIQVLCGSDNSSDIDFIFSLLVKEDVFQKIQGSSNILTNIIDQWISSTNQYSKSRLTEFLEGINIAEDVKARVVEELLKSTTSQPEFSKQILLKEHFWPRAELTRDTKALVKNFYIDLGDGERETYKFIEQKIKKTRKAKK